MFLYWAPLGAWMATIFAVSSLSAGAIEDSPLTSGNPLTARSAVAHTLEFAVLGALLFRLMRSYGLRSGPRVWGAVLALTIVYALTDEFHQSFVPGRDPSWVDVGFDSLGAVIGLVVGELAALLWRRSGV